tara:strand:+ start:1528 stop:3174 length:1647 start_codon:yes stop_codon:yes gene_type:complete
MASLKHFAHKYLPVFFLAIYSTLIILPNLGSSALQGDEGADTFISTTILKFNLPSHSDGINSSMLFADVHDGLFVYRPWVAYYIQSFSLYLFGQTTFAARLPFALIGIFTVIFLYRFALKFTGQRFVAFLASFFLASSVPSLIFFRTARYVGMPILLSILLLYFYVDIYKNKKWNPVGLIITSIIFFHTMYVEFAGVIAGVLIHFFIHIDEVLPENRKRAYWAAAITGIFCIPWLIFISPVFPAVYKYLASMSVLIDLTWQGAFKRFLGFIFEINNYFFPFIFLPLLFLRRIRPFINQVSLLLLCITTTLLAALTLSMPLLQYITAAFPLFFLLLAILLTNIFSKYPLTRSLLVAILITSNWIHVGLFSPLKIVLKDHPSWFQKSPYFKNVYDTFLREINFKSIYFDYLYEINHNYKGPLDKIVTFFKTHGNLGDTCYIDNEGESLGYYTGMKIIHRDDISELDKPDWIVLRGDYRQAVEEKPSSPIAKNIRKILSKHSYSKIELNAPAIRVNNAYDIQIHLFRSPSSADKVLIYKRTDYKKIKSTER